jgi:hypothetical protein
MKRMRAAPVGGRILPELVEALLRGSHQASLLKRTNAVELMA